MQRNSTNKTLPMIGLRFSRLLVTSFAHATSDKRFWNCLCDCGNTHIASGKSLRAGGTKSCGCLKTEKWRKRVRTHGQSKTKEYVAWQAMIQRCTKPSCLEFHRYGGRGISVCEKWKRSFEAFFADMGLAPTKKHSVDRINNDGNYEPGNCRWATMKEQCRNTAKSKFYSFEGKNLTIPEWAEITGIHPMTIWARLKKGWSVQETLTKPVDSDHRNPRKRKSITTDNL